MRHVGPATVAMAIIACAPSGVGAAEPVRASGTAALANPAKRAFTTDYPESLK